MGRAETGTIWSERQDDAVDAAERRDLPTGNGGGIQSNSNQPPLFYALETVAYLVTPSDDLLDRLVSMRLVAAAAGGADHPVRVPVPAGGVRRALDLDRGRPGGGLSAAVRLHLRRGTPDALLFTASAALFFALARAFRRGLTAGARSG